MRIFSGIQPTGRKHLGNYIGAIVQYVAGQDRGEAIYSIVDLHSLTVPFDPRELPELVYDTAAILLAAGLDPERCILFRQSDVHEHTDLTWLLTSVTAKGELERMTQYKDKAQRLESVPAGLLCYPVLMAADILLYAAEAVPVGDDQRQHLELARTLAVRFNNRYGETFTVPDAAIPGAAARVMDLQHPERKMSKSVDSPLGTIGLLDSVRQLTPLPRALGFGLSTHEHVMAIRGHAEAAVVGSALLDRIGMDPETSVAAAEGFLNEMTGGQAARAG